MNYLIIIYFKILYSPAAGIVINVPNDRKSANQVDKLPGVSILTKNKKKNFIFYTGLSLTDEIQTTWKQSLWIHLFMCMCVGFPGVLVVMNPSAKEADIRDEGLILIKGLGWKIPWGWAWQPTPVCLPGESHGQRSLVGYSPWGLQS